MAPLDQVSHHPMIVACHCEGTGWRFYGDSNLKSKFWGRSIQLDPVGILTVEFDDGTVFQWSKVFSQIIADFYLLQVYFIDKQRPLSDRLQHLYIISFCENYIVTTMVLCGYKKITTTLVSLNSRSSPS